MSQRRSPVPQWRPRTAPPPKYLKKRYPAGASALNFPRYAFWYHSFFWQVAFPGYSRWQFHLVFPITQDTRFPSTFSKLLENSSSSLASPFGQVLTWVLFLLASYLQVTNSVSVRNQWQKPPYSADEDFLLNIFFSLVMRTLKQAAQGWRGDFLRPRILCLSTEPSLLLLIPHVHNMTASSPALHLHSRQRAAKGPKVHARGVNFSNKQISHKPSQQLMLPSHSHHCVLQEP